MTTAKRLCPAAKEQGPPISDASAYQGKQSGWRRAAGSRGTGAGSPQRSPSTGGSPGDPALVGPNLLDKGVERPYTLSDIVVLVQARTHVSLFCRPCWKRASKRSRTLLRKALTTQECGALIQVLRVVDSLQDDIDFVTALRSPVGQCTAADLAHIRLYQRNSSGWARFRIGVNFPGGPPFLRAWQRRHRRPAAPFFERIERYRQYAHRHSVDALLLYIYDDCNALAYYGVQPDGAKKTENLIALWQRAQGYAQSGDGSLYGFYRCWIPPPA